MATTTTNAEYFKTTHDVTVYHTTDQNEHAARQSDLQDRWLRDDPTIIKVESGKVSKERAETTDRKFDAAALANHGYALVVGVGNGNTRAAAVNAAILDLLKDMTKAANK